MFGRQPCSEVMPLQLNGPPQCPTTMSSSGKLSERPPRSQPLVSIVLPTYNGARFLAAAIDSCVAQTYGNWELIIVDDGSRDETPRLVADYVQKDCRVQYVKHAVNRKLPAALNTGFRQAGGELLTWTSHDNLFRPTALAVMAAFLEAHPDVDVVYAERTLIDEKGRAVGYGVARPPEELPYWNAVGGCFLFRRSLADRVGPYEEQLFLAEDYEFWLRALGKCRFHALHADLYLYRVHQESLSTTRRRDVIMATRQLLERCLAEMNWKDEWRAMAYLRLARDAVTLGERRDALDYFVRAARQRPMSVMGKLALPVVVPFVVGQKGFESLKRLYSRGTGPRGQRVDIQSGD